MSVLQLFRKQVSVAETAKACCAPKTDIANAILATRELTLSYGRKRAFSPITLGFAKNTISAIIGPSGCGKTSYLSALNRMSDLNPSVSVRGEVLLHGNNVLNSNADVSQLRQRVGMIFQKPNPFPLSISKNIDLVLRELGISSKSEREDRIRSVLQQVGLWDEVSKRLNSPALNLSGGQQQRLCIARALAMNPEILLMDEPCSALDPVSSSRVEEMISALREHLTLVVVTHNMQQAKRIADQVVVFWNNDDAGCVIETGSADTVFNHAESAITRAYVEGRCC